MKVGAVLLLLAAVHAGVLGDGYDNVCDKMMEEAKRAGDLHRQGNVEKANAKIQLVGELYKEAVEMEPKELQAHLTYGTLLLNAKKAEEALKVWEAAQDGLTDVVVKKNPELRTMIQNRITKCKYGIISMERDSTYADGEGDLHKALELADQQIALRPLPQLFYDKATINVMLSNLELDRVAASIEDFKASEAAAAKGYFAGKIARGTPCTAESAVVEFPQPLEPTDFETETATVMVTPHNAEPSPKTLTLNSTKGALVTIDRALVHGGEGLVTSDECPAYSWHLEAVEAKLTQFYKQLGDDKKAKAARPVAAKYMQNPRKLKDELLKKHGAKISKKNIDTEWLTKWTEAVEARCVCKVYRPSQGYRFDFAANLPLLDIYGDHVDKKHAEWVDAAPKGPGEPQPEAILLAQFAGASFYHFVVEVLPRLVIALPSYKKGTLILIPKDTSKNSFMRTYLHLFPKHLKYRDHPPKGVTGVKKLHVPTWVRGDAVMTAAPPQVLRELRTLLTAEAKKGSQPGAVIFLSRAGAKMRDLAEEGEVVEAAKKWAAGRGLEFVVYRDPLPAVGARDLFANAALVFGVHGGAFANTIFCPRGTAIVELGFPTPYSHDYLHLSAALGLDHHLLHVAPTPLGMGAPLVSVDLPTLLSTLSAVLPSGVAEEL